MDISSKKCFNCTLKSKNVNFFPNLPEWEKKYPISRKPLVEGTFKMLFEIENPKKTKSRKSQDKVLLLVKPDKKDFSLENGIVSEITVVTHLKKHGSPFLKAHIPNVLDYFRTENSYAIVQERARGEDLVHILSNPKMKLNDGDLISIACQAFGIIKDLHKMGFTHRDIKPDNFLYDKKSKHLTMIDFGFACTNNCHNCVKDCSEYNEFCTGRKGTPIYVSPYIFLLPKDKISHYNYKMQDVYGVALTILMCTDVGNYLFQSLAEHFESCQKSNNFMKYVYEAGIAIGTGLDYLDSLEKNTDTMKALWGILRYILLRKKLGDSKEFYAEYYIPTAKRIYQTLINIDLCSST